MNKKPIWASKTLWVNAIALLGSLAITLGWDFGLTPEVQGKIVTAIMAVANIVLRFLTKSAVL